MHRHKSHVDKDKRAEHGKRHHAHEGHHGRFFEKKSHKTKRGKCHHSGYGQIKTVNVMIPGNREYETNNNGNVKARDLRDDQSFKADVDLTKCIRCGKCERICPVHAIVVTEEVCKIDTDRCDGCGSCVDRCKSGALILLGHKEEVA